jgi:glutamyl-tRNA synthetase
MKVVTRFAPSPTGFLHIGGARTALFSWLFAKHHGGKFMLRIEDTDRARSTQAAIDAILDGMKWLGLDWDGEPLFQYSRASRHAEVAEQLLKNGKAYLCYCTPEELAKMREQAQKEGKPFRYDGRWRDKGPKDAPPGIKPAVRLKAPQEGETTIHDHVMGKVTVPNSDLDDMILLRSDGTPTYMLAVVVDDHDMGVTHVIRGDDHLTNTHRQAGIYSAMGWTLPEFAHVPLIHGPDGAKLSKRHGALGVDAYRDMGYLPEAMRNYLLRLGWSHGDDEMISTEQATQWFNLESIGKSPARFDFEKLNNLNGHYLRSSDDARLLELIRPKLPQMTKNGERSILAGMKGLKDRASNLNELAESAAFYIARPPFNTKATELLSGGGSELVAGVIPALSALTEWKQERIEETVRHYAEGKGAKLGQVAQPLRAALTGSNISPGIFEVMAILGQQETIERLKNIN